MAAMEDPNNLLVQTPDGRFREMGDVAGIGSTERSRGAALADLNLDGRLDLVVVNRRAPLEIYQNLTADTGNWLLLDIRQPAPNINAMGAWVEVEAGGKRWSREITSGGGHASGARVLMHFGLGGQTGGRLRVQWPHGGMSEWVDFDANTILQVSNNSGGLVVEEL